MREYGVQAHHPGRLIERGGLNQCYLVLAECLSDEIEAVRQRCIAKASFSTLAPAIVADGRGHGLFGIDQLDLRLGEGRCNGGDSRTRLMHERPPSPGGQKSPRRTSSVFR